MLSPSHARAQCALRAVTSVAYVSLRVPNKRMLAFAGARDADGYVGKFDTDEGDKKTATYQLQVSRVSLLRFLPNRFTAGRPDLKHDNQISPFFYCTDGIH